MKATIESHAAWIPDYLQLFHTTADNWTTLTAMGCHENNIYDIDAAKNLLLRQFFLEAFHVTKCLQRLNRKVLWIVIFT